MLLYDSQLQKLKEPFSDIYLQTRFGKTHIIEIGNKSGKPLLIFHGGNTTTAYNLILFQFLIEHFHIYAVDTIGHPGKSDEICLSHKDYSYAYFAKDIIEKLGYEKIAILGCSFGGGILAKLMCIAPQKIDRAVLVCPAGVANTVSFSVMQLLKPFICYRITNQEKYLIKTALSLLVNKEYITCDIIDVLKDSFDNVKMKTGMPTNIQENALKDYCSSTLVIASEKDCLFPSQNILKRANKIFKNIQTINLKDRGHIPVFKDEEKEKIISFLKNN